MELKGKRIIVGITGSIAAYKIPILVRLLKKEGADVQIILTPSARDFVTPLTLSALSQRPALTEGFKPVDGTWNSHVELGNWADMMLIAPVSANTLGKMVNGLADNLLVATYLAAKCPVFFAPAMDLDMYKHPSTQNNIKTLVSYGHSLIAPQEGELASGLCGAGRMEEPEKILAIIINSLKKKKSLSGKKVLISAGPTFEAIDPVRFIGNHSSGRMGFALAQEAADRGAKVVLVAGPVNLDTPVGNVTRIDVTSADEMLTACMKYYSASCIIIMAAAVADYSPLSKSNVKLKKSKDSPLHLLLKQNRDILAEMGKRKGKNQVLTGFALETDHEEENALKKLKNKNLDMIVLNSLNDKGAGFGVDTNKVTIIGSNGEKTKIGLKHKTEIASDILNEIENIFLLK